MKFYRSLRSLKLPARHSPLISRLGRYALYALVLLAGLVAGAFSFYSRGLPSTKALEDLQPKQGTRVFDAGGELVYEFAEEHRIIVPLARVPKTLIEATIAIEDRGFRSHIGIDFLGYAAAVKDVLFRGKRLRGASTITQQLARNLFLTQDRTLSRKIAEAILALKIERMYPKDKILELYFNQIYYGHGAYGVETASQLFFGKHVDSLSLEQAALLAGLPRGPTLYSPYDHPQVALKRRATVLESMARTGAITREQCDKAKAAPLVLKPKELRLNDAPYFVEEIRKYLEAKYGANAIYQGQMSVYTTLDLKLQRIANQCDEDWLVKLEQTNKLVPQRKDVKLPKTDEGVLNTPYLQSAMAVMNPHSGAVLAMIGGRDFLMSKFNRAVQSRRQAGSCFKPFVYTAAVDNGFSPGDVIVDAPIVIEDDGSGMPWYPQNYDGKFDGPIPLRRALMLSKNLIAVKLIQKVGPSTVIKYARKMGIRTPLPAVLSLALGSADISLMDMVDAYAVIANRGVRVDPFLFTRITDRSGAVMEETRPYSEQALTPQTAYIMANMMESVLNGGTAYSARASGFTRPAAGKTGTTNDYTDTWFIGFTPDLICGVWVGYDQKKMIMKNATGAGWALPIWTEFMKKATASMPNTDFAVPENISTLTICSESGLLATPACPHPKAEVYITGNAPTRTCDIHKLQGVNIQSKDYNFEQMDKGSLVNPDSLR
ncbi:MAG TPA: PBP1A family penicillin-binding protein [Candidatus Edwardsbacteria bacterium]|nr:PBP1A family penicillin-binding protein [Candidatus Edwardsbacteria bacterium]